MAIEPHNAQQQEPVPTTADAATASPALSQTGAARRRWVGAGASGVLMTLASQGAMAADLVCKSPSGALSGNLASRAPKSVTCQGRSPGYWKNHEGDWANAHIAPGKKFREVFDCVGMQDFATITCMGILSHQSFDKNNLAMHLMASYLNSASGKTSFLSTETVLNMWREWRNTGGYVPSAGAKPWNAADIVLYLQSTQA